MTELLKAALYGLVEGITEWLPVSSTGHMILLGEFVKLRVSDLFWQVFLVVIQLGAILAVVLLYWNTIWPFKRSTETGKITVDKDTISLWCKAIAACLPAAVVGILADDWLDAHFYNWMVVSIMLILVGVAFLVIEKRNAGRKPVTRRLRDLTYREALIIGLFQLIAAIFPGTSRSGATILGGIMIGVSRTVAAQFTFILAIPVMFGASLLKIVKYGLYFSAMEYAILAVGMAVAFVVSVLVIRFLMGYIRRHDFRVFGWYRIILGAVVILYFVFVRR
ncbi:MAG: undecaprenyl-diphosphate phosphatase [Lachnospiraceae bacterium]|nr:undecaprenyl-diphosphate phosphatase [Lachnospiraceae bacterium]